MNAQFLDQAGATPPGPLDTVATVLLAAITATTSALALMGVNSERVWLLLDEDTSRGSIVLAAVCAVAAIGLALLSYFVRGDHVVAKSVVLAIGVGAYMLALGIAIWGAAEAADVQGRPSILDVSIVTSGEERSVVLQVAGSSVDEDERLGVRLTDVDTNTVLVESFPRPTAGKVALKATLPVTLKTRQLEAMVWTIERDDARPPRCSQAALASDAPANKEMESTESEVATPSVVADCVVLTVPPGA